MYIAPMWMLSWLITLGNPGDKPGGGGIAETVRPDQLSRLQFFALCFLVPLYFLPSIIGRNKQKQNLGTIFLINLLAGWSVVWLDYRADTRAQNGAA